MRQFFIIVFAFVLGGCNSAKDIGGMYHLISDDPALQRVTLEIDGHTRFRPRPLQSLFWINYALRYRF